MRLAVTTVANILHVRNNFNHVADSGLRWGMSQRYDFLPIVNFWGNFSRGCGILVMKLASVFCNPLVQLPVHQAGPLLSIVTVSARRHSNSYNIYPNLVLFSDPIFSWGDYLFVCLEINRTTQCNPKLWPATTKEELKNHQGLWQRPSLASQATTSSTSS